MALSSASSSAPPTKRMREDPASPVKQPRTWYFMNAQEPDRDSVWANNIPTELEPVFRKIQGGVSVDTTGLSARNLLEALELQIGRYVKVQGQTPEEVDELYGDGEVKFLEEVLTSLDEHFSSHGKEWDRKRLEEMDSNSADHISLLNFDKRGVYQFFVFE